MSLITAFKAPVAPSGDAQAVKIFLAGSIEMGTAENWQTKIVQRLREAAAHTPIAIFNPRRDDWDSSWTQTIENPQFCEQVEWELQRLEEADIIVMYIQPNTKSPISLLELGLHVRNGKMIVLCPDGFWRKGNVDIVCRRYQAQMVATEEELLQALALKVRHVETKRRDGTASGLISTWAKYGLFTAALVGGIVVANMLIPDNGTAPESH